MPQLQLVRVHEPDAVREIIAEAFKIAQEWECDESMWAHVFGKAVDLLAARIPIAPMQAPSANLLPDFLGPRR